MLRIARPLTALLLLAAAAAHADDQPIAGRRLLLTESGASRTLVVRSSDGAIALGAGNGSVDDPTVFGGSLRVRSAGHFDSFYQLPKTGWQLIGEAGQNRGYRFRSRTGPILR